MSAPLPSSFHELPPEEQRRVLRAGHHMTQLAYRHAAAVIVGPPPSIGGPINNGSGFVVAVGGRHFLGTAWHVVVAWLHRREAGERVLFQVRDAELNPTLETMWRDEANDVALIPISEVQAAQIGVSVCDPIRGWPPPHPVQGRYVLLSGFPGVVRQQEGKRVFLNAMSTLMQVTSVGHSHLVCQLEREHLVSFNENGIPPHGTDWGGMSGGPVFLVDDLVYPLVGMISEFSTDLELLRIATLSHVPFPPGKAASECAV